MSERFEYEIGPTDRGFGVYERTAGILGEERYFAAIPTLDGIRFHATTDGSSDSVELSRTEVRAFAEWLLKQTTVE